MTAKQAMKEFKAAVIALIDAKVSQDEAMEVIEEQYELREDDEDEDDEDEDFGDDDDTDEDTFEIETEDAPIKDLDNI